jgi:hypothetical protein
MEVERWEIVAGGGEEVLPRGRVTGYNGPNGEPNGKLILEDRQ